MSYHVGDSVKLCGERVTVELGISSPRLICQRVLKSWPCSVLLRWLLSWLPRTRFQAARQGSRETRHKEPRARDYTAMCRQRTGTHFCVQWRWEKGRAGGQQRVGRAGRVDEGPSAGRGPLAEEARRTDVTKAMEGGRGGREEKYD